MKKLTAREEIRNAFEERLTLRGISMTKKISSGGFMSNATYDNRKVYTVAEVGRLTSEGFTIDEDAGIWVWNLLKNL